MRIVVSTLAALLAISGPSAAMDPSWPGASACESADPKITIDAQIAGCTAVLGNPQATAKDKAWAHHNRGASYLKKDETYRAIFEFDKALALAPSAATFTARGVAYFNMKPAYDVAKLEKSVADFQSALTLDPGNKAAQRGLKTSQQALELAKAMAEE